MTDSKPVVDRLVRDVLAGDGKVPFERVVEAVLDLAELRDLARKHGAVPKGYRVERAPKRRLLPKLVDVKRPDVVQDVCQRVVAALDNLRGKAAEVAQQTAPEPAAISPETVARKDREIEALKGELARCRSAASRQRERESELMRELDEGRTRSARLRAEVDELKRRSKRRQPAAARGSGDQQAAQIHSLQRELAARAESEDGLRRLVALRQHRIRELEEVNAELRELVPAKKRRKEQAPEAPTLSDTFRLPRFLPSFYKSLEGKERRSIEKGMQAALLFCIEGPSYPGLEVKQIEGQELWSLRASIKLRVYFVLRDDNEVDFLALADREDQHTMLRRLKER